MTDDTTQANKQKKTDNTPWGRNHFWLSMLPVDGGMTSGQMDGCTEGWSRNNYRTEGWSCNNYRTTSNNYRTMNHMAAWIKAHSSHGRKDASVIETRLLFLHLFGFQSDDSSYNYILIKYVSWTLN
jgi:hypothetical protein